MTKTPVVINQIQPVVTFRVFLFFPTSLSCPRILEIQNDEKLSQVHLGEDLQSEKLSKISKTSSVEFISVLFT